MSYESGCKTYCANINKNPFSYLANPLIGTSVQIKTGKNNLFNVSDLSLIDDIYKDVKSHPTNISVNGTYSSAVLIYKDYINALLALNNTKFPKPEYYNIIVYGAPGTGKSYNAGGSPVDNQFRVTFHPDTDYASFVGSYKPKMEYDSTLGRDKIVYRFELGEFLKAYVYAWQNPKEMVELVIEELNRGNCAQIFGDIFQLLDRDEYGFSQYFINVGEDIADQMRKKFSDYASNPISKYYLSNMLTIAKEYDRDGENNNTSPVEFTAQEYANFDYSMLALPNNLIIRATMNTSDQSLFPMDSAFKRRWQWVYKPIDYSVLGNVQIALDNTSTNFYPTKWDKVLEQINTMIRKDLRSTDKQLGQYFIKEEEMKDNTTTGGKYIPLEVLRDKVLFYLFDDVYKDDEAFMRKFVDIKQNILFDDLFDSGMDFKKILDVLV